MRAQTRTSQLSPLMSAPSFPPPEPEPQQSAQPDSRPPPVQCYGACASLVTRLSRSPAPERLSSGSWRCDGHVSIPGRRPAKQHRLLGGRIVRDMQNLERCGWSVPLAAGSRMSPEAMPPRRLPLALRVPCLRAARSPRQVSLSRLFPSSC